MKIRKVDTLVEDNYYLLVLTNRELHAGMCQHHPGIGFYFQPRAGTRSPIIREDEITKQYLVIRE